MYPGYRPAPGSEWLRFGKGSLQKEWSFPHLHEPEFLYKYVLSVSFPPISPIFLGRFIHATGSYYSENPRVLQWLNIPQKCLKVLRESFKVERSTL